MFLYIALNTNLIQNDNIAKYTHSENENDVRNKYISEQIKTMRLFTQTAT